MMTAHQHGIATLQVKPVDEGCKNRISWITKTSIDIHCTIGIESC